MMKKYRLEEMSVSGNDVLQVGKARLSRDFVFHGHDFHEIMVVVRGTANHRVNDEEHPVVPGDVCVLGEGDQHGFTAVTGLELYNVMFDRNLLVSMGEDLKGLTGFQALFVLDRMQVREHGHRSRFRLDPVQLSDTEPLLAAMLEEYATGETGARSMLMACFVLLVGRFSRWYVRNRMDPPGRIDRLAVAAASLRDPLAADLEVASLAAAAQMSRRHFQRMFTEAYGISPVKYRIQARMEKACRLLREEGMSVAEIAAACGIGDSNYFSRLFRQQTGISPLEYRAAIRWKTL